MKRVFLLIALVAILGVGSSYAQSPAKVPAYRGVIEREQPNGDTLQTYLRGDEHKHWMMTVDGWQIMENKKGWLVYAKKNCKGAVVASRKKAHNEANRSKCERRWLNRKGIQLMNKEA